jgi:hypothetical protein
VPLLESAAFSLKAGIVEIVLLFNESLSFQSFLSNEGSALGEAMLVRKT